MVNDDCQVLPERFARPIDEMVGRLGADNVVARLWAGDPSLWHPSPVTQANIRRRLGWIELLKRIDADHAHEPRMAGERAEDMLWVAPGPAGAHARLWLAVTGGTRGLRLIDTFDRVEVERMLAQRPPASRIVFAADELSPEAELLAERVLGQRSTSALVDVLTARGSEVAAWFAARSASRPRYVPDGVTERWGLFSALSWLPAAYAGADLGPLLSAAALMAERCRADARGIENPGVWLGAALGTFAQEGRDKLVLLASPKLEPVAEWLAVFVGGSLAKHRRGCVPVVAEPPAATSRYGRDHLFVALDSGSADDPLRAHAAALEAAGHPVLRYRLPDAATALAHLVCWQVGVAVAALIVGVNPFDEPDAVAQRHALRHALAAETLAAPRGITPAEPAFGTTWQAALVPRRGSFIALVPYWTPVAAERAALGRLRSRLREHGLATVVVEPLRDALASTQLLHAGRPDGTIVALTRTGAAGDPLDRLRDARIANDLAAWRRQRRTVVHIEVDAAAEPVLDACAAAVHAARI